MRRSIIWSWGLAGAALVGGIATTVLTALAGSHGSPWWENAIFLAVVCFTAAVGLLVTTRQPENRIGWLLLAQASVLTFSGLAAAYARYAVLEDPGALPGGRWAVLADNAVWPLLFAPMTAIAFVFPDGHLPSPRWRKVAVAGVASFAAVVLVQFGYREEFDQPFDQVTSPAADVPGLVWALPFVLLGIAGDDGRRGLGSPRALPARDRDRAAAAQVAHIRGFPRPDDRGGVLPWCGDVALTIALVLTLIGIPAAIALAVLRYRLYDIDVVINRTLVYGVLTAVLAAIYAAIASGSGWRREAGRPGSPPSRRSWRRRHSCRHARGSRTSWIGSSHAPATTGCDGSTPSSPTCGRAGPHLRRSKGCWPRRSGDPRLELRYWLPASELYVDGAGGPSPTSRTPPGTGPPSSAPASRWRW